MAPPPPPVGRLLGGKDGATSDFLGGITGAVAGAGADAGAIVGTVFAADEEEEAGRASFGCTRVGGGASNGGG